MLLFLLALNSSGCEHNRYVCINKYIYIYVYIFIDSPYRLHKYMPDLHPQDT